jgi:hypothetical protein
MYLCVRCFWYREVCGPFDNKDLTVLTAKHAEFSLGITQSMWFFQDNESSIIKPKNFVQEVCTICLSL